MLFITVANCITSYESLLLVNGQIGAFSVRTEGGVYNLITQLMLHSHKDTQGQSGARFIADKDVFNDDFSPMLSHCDYKGVSGSAGCAH